MAVRARCDEQLHVHQLCRGPVPEPRGRVELLGVRRRHLPGDHGLDELRGVPGVELLAERREHL